MKNLIVLFSFLLPFFCISQTVEPEIYPEELMNCMQFGEVDEAQLIEFKRNSFDLEKSLDECHNYPTTVFVLHTGEESVYNISDNQVTSAMESLEVYWHNDSIYSIDEGVEFPHTFPLVEIVRIDLSQYFDDAEDGINTSLSTNESAGSGVNVGQILQLVNTLGYDTENNFHMYSYPFVGNILGFAWLGNMGNGCWVRFNQFGDRNWEADGEQFIGNPSNLTTVHEVGHIFNLRHTFDFTNNDCTPVQTDDNCGNVNDRVCDTPVQTVTWGCAPTCGENPRNHMGYRNCRERFTQGQLERALASEASSWNNFDNYRRCDVEGCTDELACNFNSEATLDDGLCVFNGDTCTVNGNLGIVEDCECNIILPYISSFSPGECTDSLRFYFKSAYEYSVDSMIVQIDNNYSGIPMSYDTTIVFIPEEPFEEVTLNWITLPQSNAVYGATVSYIIDGDTTWVDDFKFYCPAPPDTPGCGITLENGQYSLPDNAFYFAVYLLEAGAPDIELIEDSASNYTGALDLPELEIGQYFYFKILFNDGTQCTYYTAIAE